jgi:CHAD domain-containing protein
MNRVLKELAAFRKNATDDTVHDLRVWMRRCRSLASAMREVDPHPAWPEMRSAAKALFRDLGDLRDSHVLMDWTKRLGSEDDPLREELLAELGREEAKHGRKSARAAAKFDEKRWKQISRVLRRRARYVTPKSLVAECLALERLEEAKELHRRALRTNRPRPWHALRIGIKHFRYTCEALLPDRAARWLPNLKKLQDLLGEVHDLEELHGRISRLKDADEARCAAWNDRIRREQAGRIEHYRRMTLGTGSVWHEWDMALPRNGRCLLASAARLRATARAADPDRRRTGEIRRVACAIYRVLRRTGAVESFRSADAARIFDAAARLSGIRVSGKSHSRRKARKFLRSAPVPPGWKAAEWAVLAASLRYQRGTPPSEEHKRFAELSESDQKLACATAGTMRLARGLSKHGVRDGRGMRGELLQTAFVLHAPALDDSAEAVTALATAKQLLDRVLPAPVAFKRAESEAAATESRQAWRAMAAAGD